MCLLPKASEIQLFNLLHGKRKPYSSLQAMELRIVATSNIKHCPALFYSFTRPQLGEGGTLSGMHLFILTNLYSQNIKNHN